MKSKKIPPFIPWIAAGAVLFFCSYIPIRLITNREIVFKIAAVSSLVAAFLWFFVPELMENHRYKLYGIWFVLVGAYMAFSGLLYGGSVRGMDGLLMAVIGIGILVIT